MNRKENYRDISKWQKTARRQRQRYYRKTQNALNSKQRWTQKEIELVMKHKMTDSELSELIGRSVMAIQAMRYKQKKDEKMDNLNKSK